MSQSENCSNEISVINQESKVNGKIDSIEGQLSFMGEGTCDNSGQSTLTASAVKDESSFSLLFPKRFGDSQDTQDDLRSAPDLPNGHNNPDAVDIVSRTKSLDELLQESEDLPDTEIIGCTKEFVESKMETQNSPGGGADDEGEKDKPVSESKEETGIENNKDIEIKNSTSSTVNSNKEEDSNPEIENDNSSDEKEKNQEESNIEMNDVSSSTPAEGPIPEKIIEENEESSKKEMKNETDSKNCTSNDEKSPEIKEDSFKLELNDSLLIPAKPTKEIKESVTEIEDNSKEEKDDENSVKDKENDEHINTDITINTESITSEECNCTPECHMRMKLIKKYLGNASSQLDSYIKLKKQEELTNLLNLLNDIELLAENKKTDISEDLLNDGFQEELQGSKKRKPRASKMTKAAVNTPKKEVPEKKNRIRESKKEERSEINFKNLKGLAVFAKWPNSGWYYPGIIEGLTNSDWKEATNVTVKFYDGLVREMKNINILPAHLIPTTSIVCDLDDETEMVVLSTNRIDNNSVEFTLSTKEGVVKNLELNFNKLAIKALHMKSIKQQLEPNMDVMPKKMHMVSLDNLVSGRRSRIRTHKDDDDESTETATTPRKNVRKTIAPDVEKSLTVDASPALAIPTKHSPNKRSTPKRTATPNKRMKQ